MLHRLRRDEAARRARASVAGVGERARQRLTLSC